MTLEHTDSYKLSHEGFMNKGTTLIYNNLTARTAKHSPVLPHRFDNKVVFFGLQYFIKDYFINEWNRDFFSQPKEKVVGEFKRLVDAYLCTDVPVDRFEELHDLGYLPIHIKAVEEGSRVNIGVPLWTTQNTHPDKDRFAFLTNYLETVESCENWKPITTATTMYYFRKMVNEFALKTTGSLDFTMFQLHDFSFRGMSGRHDAAINGAAFLLSSCGTDTIPAIPLLEKYYNADVTKEFIATSVPASEHSVACLGTAVEGELESYRKWITKDYPTGIVSLVSDTYDYWKVLTEYLPALKEDILNRPVNAIGLSKVVIRPDSGNPVDIICGLGFANCYKDYDKRYCRKTVEDYATISEWKYYEFQGKYYLTETDEEIPEAVMKGSVELLWEIFGGTITPQGYKLLDSHIGLIYGDSITMAVAEEVFKKLEAKGFASTNVVFGIGSYSLQHVTRDSFGMAVKATYAEVDGKGYELFKDPKTDGGMKKSAKGLLRVEKEGDNYVLYDQQTPEQEQQGELKTVFLNGKLVRETSLSEIRKRLWEEK